MEEEETSVPRLLRLINVQLRELQSEVQDVRRDLSRLREVHKQSCSSVAEELGEAAGETSRQSICTVRHYSLGITLKDFLEIISLLSEPSEEILTYIITLCEDEQIYDALYLIQLKLFMNNSFLGIIAFRLLERTLIDKINFSEE